MKRVSAIVHRPGIIHTVQTWVYRDKDGNWRNFETHKLEPTARLDFERDLEALERQWGSK